jgi:hypothetical protein
VLGFPAVYVRPFGRLDAVRRTILIGLVLTVLAGIGTGSAPARASRSGGSFPCRWRWDLQAGLRDGFVTAANSADCSGRTGSLTLSVRLLRLNPKTRKWRADKKQTRTWSNLSRNRYIELSEKCVGGTVRAEFGWILRDSGGSVVARNAVRTPPYRDPGPGCRIGIS